MGAISINLVFPQKVLIANSYYYIHYIDDETEGPRVQSPVVEAGIRA